MINRKILAVVIPALLVAGTANAAEVYNKDGNKLDLYGRASALHYFASNGDQNGDNTSARLGIKGETLINSELRGYGQFEYKFVGNKTENEENGTILRLAFAGLKFGDYGSLDYGRNYGLIYDTASWTDVLPEFGGESVQNDVYTLMRANGLLTYRNTDFFGLVEGWNFALQYQGKNERSSAGNDDKGTLNAASRAATQENGDGFAISTDYKLGWGISAGASYFTADRTDDVINGIGGTGAKGKTAEGFGTALKYDANNVYIAATYSEYLNTMVYDNQVANKARNIELVAQYQFDFGLRPSVAYVQSRGFDLDSSSPTRDTLDLQKYVEVGATYYFNKNISTYVDYKINLLDKDKTYAGNPTNNIVATGLVYQF